MRMVLSVALAVMLCMAAPVLAATSRSDTVSGTQSSPTDGTLRFVLPAEGALPGVLVVSVNPGASGASGTFYFHAVDVRSGVDSGFLRGDVVGGTVTGGGNDVTALDLVLSITNGSGQYESVSGSGTLKVATPSGGSGLAGALLLSF